MATSWYDPTGSNAGFYNSPEDFLFKSQGGTWYGQGPAGQKDAARMPTMAEYNFSGPPAAPKSQEQIFNEFHKSNFASDPRFNPASAAPTPQQPGRVGGSFLNLGNNVSVPQGPLWQRYQAMQADPSMIEADPAYQYLRSTGEEALSRSAGARRKRFSGETMLDFLKHAEGLAATNLRSLLPELRAGAQQEYGYAENEAQAGAQRNQMRALTEDPYGVFRNRASRYRTVNEFMASPEYAAQARAGRGQQAIQQYMRGQELNKSMGF